MHTLIINTIDSAELRPIYQQGDGVCHGIAITLLLSIFSDNFEAAEETFDAAQYHFGGLSMLDREAKLLKLKSLLIKRNKTETEKKYANDYLNIIALFSCIAICQSASDFRQIIYDKDKPFYSQDDSIDYVSRFFLFQSDSRRHVYQMKKLDGFTSVYTEASLMHFFNTVCKQIIDKKTMAGFTLSYLGHVISCAYRPQKNHWILSSDGEKITTQHTNLSELTTRTWNALKSNKQDYRVLYIRPIVNEKNRSFIELLIKPFLTKQYAQIPYYSPAMLCGLYMLAKNYDDNKTIDAIEKHKNISMSQYNDYWNLQILLQISDDSIIYNCIENNLDDIARKLAQICPLEVIDTITTDNETLLLYALKNKKRFVADEILSRMNLHISLKDKDGNTALFYALDNEYYGIAKTIIQKTTYIKAANTDFGHAFNNWTVLHYAARYGLYDIAQTMLTVGVDPNTPTMDGWTPLHLAASNGHNDIVRLFLKNQKVNVFARNSRGDTPIDSATQRGYLEKYPTMIKYSKYEALLKFSIFNHLHSEHGYSNTFISKLFEPLSITTQTSTLPSLQASDPIAQKIVAECAKKPSDTDMLRFLRTKLYEADEAALKGDNSIFLRNEASARILYCIDMLGKNHSQLANSFKRPSVFG